MSLRDILHDETDAVEELRERSLLLVDRARERVLDFAAETESFEDLLALITVAVGVEMSELTTEAARKGFEFGKLKVKGAK